MKKLGEVNQTLSRPALERLLKRRVTGRSVEELGAYPMCYPPGQPHGPLRAPPLLCAAPSALNTRTPDATPPRPTE